MEIVRSACLEFTPKYKYRPCGNGELVSPRKKGFNGMAYRQEQTLGAGATKTMLVEYSNHTRFILKQIYKMGKYHGRWETISKTESKNTPFPHSKFSKRIRTEKNKIVPEDFFKL